MTEIQYREIPIDLIDPSPDQTRSFGEHTWGALAALTTSIEQDGILEPIVVRPAADGERFILIAGERRTRAAGDAGLETIPAVIRDVDDATAARLTLVENLQREDLPPIEAGCAVARLLDQEGVRLQDVAEEIGRSPAWVAKRARIATISDEWKEAVAGELAWLTASHLELVARLTPDAQKELLGRKGFWAGQPTAGTVRNVIDNDILHTLDSAPWKRDDADLLPKAGPCTECPKRTGASPTLWSEDDDGATDRCMDGACYKAKGNAFVQRRYDQLVKKHGRDRLLLVTTRYYFSDNERTKLQKSAMTQHNVKELKKSEPDARPVLIVDGARAGTTYWGNTYGSGSSDSEPPRPKTVAEKRADLQRLRDKITIELLLEQLEEVDVGEVLSLQAVAALVVVVGTASRADTTPSWDRERQDAADGSGYHWWTNHLPSSLPGNKTRRSSTRSKAWAIFHGHLAGDDAGALVRDLWVQVLGVFQTRLAYAPAHDIDAQMAEARELANLVDIDIQPCVDAAIEAKPEPKVWAKQEAAEKADEEEGAEA